MIDSVLPILYEATMDPAAWLAALARIADLFDAQAVTILSVEKAMGRVLDLRAIGFAEAVIHEFTFRPEEDTLYQASLRDPGDDPIVGVGDITDAELRASRLYEQLMVPQGLRYALGGRFENSERVYSALGLFRKGDHQPFGAAERTLLRELIPHVRASVRVSRRLSQADSANRASRVTMQFSRHGVILLDRAGKVMFMNEEATRIGAARDGIQLRRGLLEVADRKAGAALARFIDYCGPPRGKRRMQCRLRIARPSGSLPYELLVLPLDEALSAASLFPDGSAHVVLVSDPVEVFNISRQTLVNYYGLSVTQARLCRVLLRTGSIEAAAGEMGIAMNSARTHLRRAYEKLGVTSQLDLLLLLGSTIRGSDEHPGRDQRLAF